MELRRETDVRQDVGVQSSEASPRPKRRGYRIIKRCFDFVASLIASILLLAPMALLCAWVVMIDFGNPFYVHKRVGKHGKELPMVKIRSMKLGADDVKKTLNPMQLEEYYKEYKLKDDPRLIGWRKTGDGTRCAGALIRRTSLDELPQIFWNILIRGNMSIVGPRPILWDELNKHYTPQEQQLLLSVKPGLTGYWAAYARNNATYESGERQRMELYYVQHQSIWLDIKIMFATVSTVLRKMGAN